MRKLCQRLLLGIAAILASFSSCTAFAQEIQLNVTYVCSGQRVVVENCNIRDLSDTSTCFVGHPDHILPNGLMAYTNETRGALKKLLPTCKQPSADEVSRAKAFQKKVDEKQAAAEKKANDENDAIEARAQAVITGKKPQSADQKAMNRCITAGRVPAVCMGNALNKPLEDMLGKLLPGAVPPLEPGLNMRGNFAGSGSWRIEFDEHSAAMNCADLAPEQRSYSVEIKNNLAFVKIQNTPKPLILAMKADGTLVGSGPVVVNGSIVSGRSGGGAYTPGTPGGMTTSQQTTTTQITPMEAQAQRYDGGTFSQNGGMVDHTTTTSVNTYHAGTPATYSGPTVTYAPATRTCSQAALSSKHAQASGTDLMQGMATSLFNGGDSGPPVPPGLRMHGSYGGDGGIGVEFYPESAIVSCGEAARAYPYTIEASGSQAVIKIDDPARPVVLTLQPDGKLNAAPGPYEVHGRSITGQNENGDFTFAPFNRTCNLGVLAAGANPSAPPAMAAAPSPVYAPKPGDPVMATPNAPTGNAVLTILSGFPAQPGVLNPLAVHSYVLLRDPLATGLIKGGVPVPAGTSPLKVIGTTCAGGKGAPECQKTLQAVNADTASAIRSDVTGKASFPGVPPGTYYLMISTRFNNQSLYWDLRVDLKAGTNSVTLDQHNSSVIN